MKKTIHSIRKQEDKNAMEKAAEFLFSDYKNDTELIAFTSLDFEDFYETK
jgi:hypothetical protein